MYRRLEQDVELFQEFGAQIKKLLQEQNVTVTQDEAEARMVYTDCLDVSLVTPQLSFCTVWAEKGRYSSCP